MMHINIMLFITSNENFKIAIVVNKITRLFIIIIIIISLCMHGLRKVTGYNLYNHMHT